VRLPGPARPQRRGDPDLGRQPGDAVHHRHHDPRERPSRHRPRLPQRHQARLRHRPTPSSRSRVARRATRAMSPARAPRRSRVPDACTVASSRCKTRSTCGARSHRSRGSRAGPPHHHPRRARRSYARAHLYSLATTQAATRSQRSGAQASRSADAWSTASTVARWVVEQDHRQRSHAIWFGQGSARAAPPCIPRSTLAGRVCS